MITALLIGFKYKREYQELHGIIIDLYHAYTHLKSLGANIKIITDMIDDEQIKLVKDAVYAGDVHSDIVTFVTTIREEKEHLTYTNSSDLISETSGFVHNSGQVFFYYTGHGDNGYFLLPQGERISMKEFSRILITNSQPGADIVSINDCCNADNMGIPFCYTKDRYRLINDTRIFTTSQIIHMVSTKPDETSIMKGRGSIFTKQLFGRLVKGDRDLRKCLEEIRFRCRKIHSQTATLYVSNPTITTWPRWLFIDDDNNLQINYQRQLHCINLRKKPYNRDEKHQSQTPHYCELLH